LEGRAAEMALEIRKADMARRDSANKYQELLAEHNNLRKMYMDADAKATRDARQMIELQSRLEQVQYQLTGESNSRAALTKDNYLLRSQIAEMSSAQEPLRDEQYYILEFTQIRSDIESWAAKETRTTTKPFLSETASLQLISHLKTYGETGSNAAEWFQHKERKFFQERRNQIALIRHLIAVVLFDQVFNRFAFGFDRNYSTYFTDVEKLICKQGLVIYKPGWLIGTYSLTKILTIRQAIGQAVITLQKDSVPTLRSSAINSLIRLLQELLPKTRNENIQTFAVKVMDKSIALKTAMTEEQAIYRSDFFDSGEDFQETWIEIDPNDNPNNTIAMCTFPCLRRFTTNQIERQWIPIVKATAKLNH
jgi:hypothetical protein